MGGKTTKLLDSLGGSNVVSDVIYPQMRSDERGIFQVAISSGGLTDGIFLQGRMDDSTAWSTIEVFTHVDTGAEPNDTIASVIKLFPQMRAGFLTAGLGTFEAWLTE